MISRTAEATKIILQTALPHYTHVEFNQSYQPGPRELYTHTFVLPTAPLRSDKTQTRYRNIVQINLYSPLRNGIIDDDARGLIQYIQDNPIQHVNGHRVIFNNALWADTSVNAGITRITTRSTVDQWI